MSSTSKITVSETVEGRPARFGTPPKKANAIRSSIDLELQLGFERNPLDKPSSDFRDADSWFSQAKQTAETAAVHEESQKKKDRVARPEQARKSHGVWGTGRSSRHMDTEPDQQNDDTYVAPTADRSSFFRSSFFGGVPRSTMEQTSPLPPTRNTARRPMGPRQLNGVASPPNVVHDDFQLRSMKSAQSMSQRSQTESAKDLYDSDPAEMLKTPLWYFQLRVWINAVIFLCAGIAGAILAGLSGHAVSPSPLSSNFWIATSLFSVVIALTQVIFYYARGSKMLYHYDTPFLLLTSSASAGTGLTKVLAKRDLYLPAIDMIAHGLVVIFWIGALSDVGTGIGSCRTATLTLGISAGVCTGLEAAVSFGVIAIVGFVFTTGMKSWELYSNMGLIRKAI